MPNARRYRQRAQWVCVAEKRKTDTLLQTPCEGSGRHSTAYDPQKPPYAVFDWDNTSVFLNIKEAVLVYQIQNLVFGATPEQLNEAICKNIGDGDFAPEFNNLQSARVSITQIAPDIAESYALACVKAAKLRKSRRILLKAMRGCTGTIGGWAGKRRWRK